MEISSFHRQKNILRGAKLKNSAVFVNPSKFGFLILDEIFQPSFFPPLAGLSRPDLSVCGDEGPDRVREVGYGDEQSEPNIDVIELGASPQVEMGQLVIAIDQ